MNQFAKLFGFADKSNQEEIKHIPLDAIVPSPFQPRTIFQEEKLDELCQTIKTHGVIQPIVVRVKDNRFEIIAGERRFRAVRKLGLPSIPAIVKEMNDSQAASMALIENLQREGLTSIEEAVAYEQLLHIHELTQEGLAQRLGKSQSTIANKLRPLQLGEPVKQALLDRLISERHARALLALESDMQEKVLREIIAKDLNVKQTEARVNFHAQATKNKKSKRVSFARDVRLAVNTIRQSVEMVAGSGMKVLKEENDTEEYYEIRIRIPKRNKD